jgi:hypothetical protein
MSESNIEVTLREITKDNWRDLLRLKVAPCDVNCDLEKEYDYD